MTTNNFNPEISNSNLNSPQYYVDDDGTLKFISPYIASSNFDGSIPVIEETIDAEDIKPGMLVLLDDQNYYAVVSVSYDDVDLEASPSTNITVGYIDSNNELATIVYNFTDQVDIRYEDWDNKNLGSQGWTITSGGNAIFANVGVRGDLEATTLDVGGTNGIVYDGATVTIGASVIINAPLTVSGNFIVSGSAAQDIISNNTTITGGNIATGKIKSQGYSGPGTASAFSASGMLINLDDGSITAPNFKIDSNGGAHFKGVVQTASGTVGGFNLSASQISIAGFTMSTASGISLGSTSQFKVDTLGNLVATSASIVGNITANSGNIGGFNLSSNSLNATNFAVSTTGGLALGSASQFYVSTSGDLRANSASISGDITAQSGKFIGSVGIVGGGNLYAGANPTTGQRVIVSSSGLFGFDSGNINIFSIPITGSPTIAGFTLINTGITGSGQMSNMIFGTRDANAYNITIRGDKTGGQAAAIYTVLNGVDTTSTSNNGFYLDDLGKLRLAGANGSLRFDGSNLFVTGAIIATSGSFSGWLQSSSITGGIISSGSFVGGILQSTGYSGVADGSAFSTTGTNFNLNTGAITGRQFRIDASGNATFSGQLNAAEGTFAGTLSANSITSGTLDSARINVDTLTVRNLLSYSSNSASRIKIQDTNDQRHKLQFETGWSREVIPAFIGASNYKNPLVGFSGESMGVEIYAGTLDLGVTSLPSSIKLISKSFDVSGVEREILYGSDLHWFSNLTNVNNSKFLAYGFKTIELTSTSNNSTNTLYSIRMDATNGFNITGPVTFTGNVNGTFVGDGSGLTNLPSGASSPTGTIVMYGGSSAPTGWLLCDGAAVSRSTYSALWAVLGSSYGNGNGSTTFNVPNFITGGPGGTPAFARGGNTPGNTGGVATHTLTLEQIPQHTHNVGTLAISGTSGGSGELTHSGTIDSKGAHSHTISGQVGSGGGHSHTYTAPDSAVTGRSGTGNLNVVPNRTTGTATSSEPSHQHGAGTLAADSAGSHQHTITINAHASHTHGAGSLAISGATGNVTSRGATDSINNQPPYIVVNFIIKT